MAHGVAAAVEVEVGVVGEVAVGGLVTGGLVVEGESPLREGEKPSPGISTPATSSCATPADTTITSSSTPRRACGGPPGQGWLKARQSSGAGYRLSGSSILSSFLRMYGIDVKEAGKVPAFWKITS